MKPLSDEAQTLAYINYHRGLVRANLMKIAMVFITRAIEHDLSKFMPDEFAGMVEIGKVSREHPYGSPEYNESLKDNHAIDMHFSRNRHHPEYHPNGVRDMNLIDFVEMVVDWRAAWAAKGDVEWERVLEIQTERFDLSPFHLELVKMIVSLMMLQ